MRSQLLELTGRVELLPPTAQHGYECYPQRRCGSCCACHALLPPAFLRTLGAFATNAYCQCAPKGGIEEDYFTTRFLETTIFVARLRPNPRRSRSCQHGTAISPRSHKRQSYTHRKATPTLLNRQWPTGGLGLALLCHVAADYLIRKRAEVDLRGFSTASLTHE